MANPPFNVDKIDKEKLKNDPRFPFGLPNVDNGNYVWIQMFYSALNEDGRAGFVMANSAADARHSEKVIRKKIIKEKTVDIIISVASNFFYNVSNPCTLWFFDKEKTGTERENKILFIDARDIYHEVEKAQYEFRPEQIEFISNIARLYRHDDPEFLNEGTKELIKENFDGFNYKDIPGLCAAANIADIKGENWSLNPGRYVGVSEDGSDEEFNFRERVEGLYEKFEELNSQANSLKEKISEDINDILS